jgi:hypothetical protein
MLTAGASVQINSIANVGIRAVTVPIMGVVTLNGLVPVVIPA